MVQHVHGRDFASLEFRLIARAHPVGGHDGDSLSAVDCVAPGLARGAFLQPLIHGNQFWQVAVHHPKYRFFRTFQQHISTSGTGVYDNILKGFVKILVGFYRVPVSYLVDPYMRQLLPHVRARCPAPAHGAGAQLFHQVKALEAGCQRCGQAHVGAGLFHHAYDIWVIPDQYPVDGDIQL
jgi:hypothetical protein